MDKLSAEIATYLAGQSGPAGPVWAAELRSRGAEIFRTNGLPGLGVERWKYTSLRALERRAPRLGPAAKASDSVKVPQPLVEGTPRVALVNGDWSVIDGALPAGVTALPLVEALQEDDGAIRAQLETLGIAERSEGFSALNTAMLGAGVFIHVAAGVDAGSLLLQWLQSTESTDELSNSRICVILEAEAKLELLEQFENAPDTAPMLNVVTQCRLGRGAALDHVRLQQEGSRSILLTRTDISQAADSHYHHTGLDLGGGLVRHDVQARLLEAGAVSRIHCACLAWGRTHVDHHLDIDHAGPDCMSSQVYRGVLGDRSRAVFNGRVYVAEGADGTEARQSSAGLLLSPHAEIDAKPELEIYADEVVASHGATVGQLDEDALFYLRSRGVDMATARNLLTLAFCRSVVDQLPSDALREALGQRLEAGLRAGGVKS